MNSSQSPLQQQIHHYHLCGVGVASEIALPELGGALSEPPAKIDINFMLGAVPRPDPADGAAALQIDAAGTATWTMAGRGIYRVADGRTITIDPEPGASEVAVRAGLVGPLQSLLWLQRGRFALHATAVSSHHGRTLCIAGTSRAGKSVLAGLLVEQGMSVLADDLAVFTPGPPPRLLPGYARLRLRNDVAGEVVDGRRVAAADATFDKSVIALDATAALPDAVPVCDLILLERRAATATLVPLDRLMLLNRWRQTAHLPDAMRAMGRVAAFLHLIDALFTSGARAWSLQLPDDIDQTRRGLPDLLRMLNY